MRTYEELLAAQTELAHFNKHHDPSTGQFTSGNGVSSRKAAKEEKRLAKEERKFAKQEGILTAYREAAKSAYNSSANALSYMNTDKKRQRKKAGIAAARYYEIGEIYKQKAEKQLEKINKNGTRILMSSLDPYSKAVGEAFIKRSIASQISWQLNPFESASGSALYKINKDTVQKKAKEYEEIRKSVTGE